MKTFIKKWWKCCIISAALCAACAAIIVKSCAAAQAADSDGKTSEQVTEESTKDIILSKRSAAGTEDLCIVVKDENADILNNLYNNRYVLLENKKGGWLHCKLSAAVRGVSYDVPAFEKYDLDLYDIDTLQLVNHMDVKKLLDNIQNGNEMYTIGSVWTREDRTLRVRLDPVYDYKKNRWLVYDLLTGELLTGWKYPRPLSIYDLVTVGPPTRQEDTVEPNEEYQKKLSLLTEGYVKEGAYEYSLPAQNGFSQFDCREVADEPGTARVELAAADLPINNKALYSAFPDLRQMRGKLGYRVGVYLHGYMEPEAILSLFMNDGDSIQYRGMTVSDRESYDGEEHPVKNAKEYYHWICREF